jgi:hypothetical protein
MKWAAIGFGLGAVLLLVPALFYLLIQTDPENRSTARYYLMPGATILGLAAIFALVWLVRHAG